MTNMATVEIKAFVPARDFELSKRFYKDMGFELAWSSDDLAYFHANGSSFLLQRFYVKEHADNFMMHMLVEDVEAWWRHVDANQLSTKYGVRALPPENRPWGIRDFTVNDPTGVLWRIGQNIENAAAGDAGGVIPDFRLEEHHEHANDSQGYSRAAEIPRQREDACAEQEERRRGQSVRCAAW